MAEFVGTITNISGSVIRDDYKYLWQSLYGRLQISLAAFVGTITNISGSVRRDDYKYFWSVCRDDYKHLRARSLETGVLTAVAKRQREIAMSMSPTCPAVSTGFPLKRGKPPKCGPLRLQHLFALFVLLLLGMCEEM